MTVSHAGITLPVTTYGGVFLVEDASRFFCLVANSLEELQAEFESEVAAGLADGVIVKSEDGFKVLGAH